MRPAGCPISVTSRGTNDPDREHDDADNPGQLKCRTPQSRTSPPQGCFSHDRRSTHLTRDTMEGTANGQKAHIKAGAPQLLRHCGAVTLISAAAEYREGNTPRPAPCSSSGEWPGLTRAG